MAAVELHVSSCGRCQAIVGAVARSAPLIEPVVNEGWFRFPRWALAPLAAAAAITVWMVVPQDTTQPPRAAAPAAERRQDAPRQDATPLAQDSTAQSPAKELADAGAPRPAPSPAPAPARREEFSEAKRQGAGAAAGALQDRAQLTEEPTAALGAAASPAPPAAPLAEATLQKSAARAVALLEIVSPDASRRWRIVNSAIERSEDGGASWVATRTLSGQTITGGSSPTGSVCWLIGSAGTVMIAADGITFSDVSLPEPVDLTAITAADARSATVTSADGRRFRTDDSGRTWRQI